MQQGSLSKSTSQSEARLEFYSSNKNYCDKITEGLISKINEALRKNDPRSILSLKEDFSLLSTDPHFYPSAETKRIQVLLKILETEMNNSKFPFFEGIADYEELMERYTLTTLYLRRIELQLEPDLVATAAAFLRSIPLTLLTAEIFFQNELFENRSFFYQGLYTHLKDVWELNDKIVCLEMILDEKKDIRSILELAMLYMESHAFSRAYELLEEVDIPSPEITSLKSLLKEVIKHE